MKVIIQLLLTLFLIFGNWSAMNERHAIPAHSIDDDTELPPPLPTGVEGDWVLTFEDDFDGEALDKQKWNDQWGAPGAYWGPPNTVMWSDEIMLPENVIVENGLLRLRHQRQGNQITAGVITTNGLFTQQYGFFEARLRANETPGVLSAFWMQYSPDHWPPEIDIAEILANDWKSSRHVIHYGYPGHQSNTYINRTDHDLTADFHVYGLAWNAEELIFYVDGEEVNRINSPDEFNNFEMYLQLNMHSGNGFSGYPPKNDKESFMEVDYVRVWQYAELVEDAK